MNYEYQLLRRKQVEELTSLSRSSIYRLMGKGLFPKSKGILGGNIVIWVRKEVEEWIKEQVETAVA
jgi:prophage regulatory protein|tara:strand:- start:60 stop:257 length:198 start_codon:yes stop_codon:yes gene_type:complete